MLINFWLAVKEDREIEELILKDTGQDYEPLTADVARELLKWIDSYGQDEEKKYEEN